jgi:hypothetical protein
MRHEQNIRAKASLAFGFLMLAAGVAVAYRNPATGYELSIYTATPVWFWVGVGMAAVTALVTALCARSRSTRVLGLVLGGGAFVAIAGLPLLRNYHYYGTSDALTHLGWAREIAAGDLGLLSLLYPGIHTFSVVVAELTGYPLTRSLMYVVLAMAVLFVVFTPLCAWRLTRDWQVTTVAAFAAFMLMPITNISTQMVAHTTTQTLLFLPIPVYLLVRYFQTNATGGRRPTAPGSILLVSLFALILYHPQQALNLLIVFAATASLQFVARKWWHERSASEWGRSVYAQTGVFAVALAVWLAGHERFRVSVENMIRHVTEAFVGQERLAAEAAQRTSSLSAVGSGLLEIFLKLFAVPAVFSLVTIGVLALTVFGRFADDRALDAFNKYLTAAFVPVTALFAVYFAASVRTQAFRHLAFIMVFVTLVGSVGIGIGIRRLSRSVPNRLLGSAVTVVLLVALVVSVATVFPSPWIFLHNQHVTEQTMSGYEVSLDYADAETRMRGVRGGTERYADAYRGPTGVAPSGSVNETVLMGNTSGAYGGEWYFTVTRTDQRREVGSYDELRYSAESFASPGHDPGVNTVIDNGEFTLYQVPG